jgi:hypothetical protein
LDSTPQHPRQQAHANLVLGNRPSLTDCHHAFTHNQNVAWLPLRPRIAIHKSYNVILFGDYLSLNRNA